MTKELSLKEKKALAAQQAVGLELYNSDDAKKGRPYIMLMSANSRKVVENNIPAGSLINGATDEILCKLGESFNFIPLFFFRDWSIWENEKVVKRSLDRKHFTKIEMAWTKSDKGVNIPPAAQEAVNFIVVKEDDLETPLIFSFSGYKKIEVGEKLLQTIINKQKEGLPIYGGVYSTKISTTSGTSAKDGKKYTWHTYDNVQFISEIEDETIYNSLETKNKQLDPAQLKEQLLKLPEATEVVKEENPEF